MSSRYDIPYYNETLNGSEFSEAIQYIHSKNSHDIVRKTRSRTYLYFNSIFSANVKINAGKDF